MICSFIFLPISVILERSPGRRFSGSSVPEGKRFFPELQRRLGYRPPDSEDVRISLVLDVQSVAVAIDPDFKANLCKKKWIYLVFYNQ